MVLFCLCVLMVPCCIPPLHPILVHMGGKKKTHSSQSCHSLSTKVLSQLTVFFSSFTFAVCCIVSRGFDCKGGLVRDGADSPWLQLEALRVLIIFVIIQLKHFLCFIVIHLLIHGLYKCFASDKI
jgi:hypothetical protein